MDARRRREAERQVREWREHDRFEELESDDNNGQGVGRLAGDRVRFTGYDLGTGKHDRRRVSYDDLAYGEDYGDEGDDYYEEEDEWQSAMRQKEDDLVQGALRRIRRAKLRGESNVDLTREELDALERRSLLPTSIASKSPRKQPSRASLPGSGSKAKRQTSGLSGLGGTKGKAPKSEKKVSLPLVESSPHFLSGPDSPDYGLHGNRRDPAQDYLAQSGARPASTPSKALARKPAPGNARQQQSQPYDSQQYRFFSPNEDGSRPPSSSSRGSPTRSLPDEPDWTPRSHTSSSAPLYSADPFDYQTHGPSAQYQHGRRNFSGPAGVSYSALRRVPVPASGAMTRVPTSEPAPMQRSASGLSNEVIEISSDDDSDEGVRVDSQGYSTGYGVVARGGGRVRPGRR